MASYDLSEEHRLLAAWHAEAYRFLDRDDAFLFTTREAVSAWSPAQHLYHTAAATGMMLKAALVISRGSGREEGEPNRVGRIVLERGRFTRGVVQAPDRLQPPPLTARAPIREALDRAGEKIEAIKPVLPSLPEQAGRLPHPYMGPLNAAEWVRIVRIHADHHQRIIDDIAKAQE